MSKLKKYIAKQYGRFYIWISPYLLKISKFFKKLGIDKVIEIRIWMTIFFYLFFICFCLGYILSFYRFINSMFSVSISVIVIIFCLSVLFLIFFMAMEYAERKYFVDKSEKKKNKQ